MESVALAKPNYQFEKRQRDLEKKKKQEEKRLKKIEKKTDGDAPPASVGNTPPASATDPTSTS